MLVVRAIWRETRRPTSSVTRAGATAAAFLERQARSVNERQKMRGGIPPELAWHRGVR